MQNTDHANFMTVNTLKRSLSSGFIYSPVSWCSCEALCVVLLISWVRMSYCSVFSSDCMSPGERFFIERPYQAFAFDLCIFFTVPSLRWQRKVYQNALSSLLFSEDLQNSIGLEQTRWFPQKRVYESTRWIFEHKRTVFDNTWSHVSAF